MTSFSSLEGTSFAHFENAFGKTVEYGIKASGESVSVTAIPSNESYEVFNEYDHRLIFESRDFEIRVSALDAAPAQGDTITETINGVAEVYEAYPIANRTHMEYADDEKTIYIIHTRKQPEGS